jgi:hypothetical protein
MRALKITFGGLATTKSRSEIYSDYSMTKPTGHVRFWTAICPRIYFAESRFM